MLLPLFGLTPKAITVPLPEPPPIVRQVEPTLEEKIKTNFYKCNTDIEWIWASDATCHPKQPKDLKVTQRHATEPQNTSGNLYEYHSCTWWVKQWRSDVGNWGDAKDWGYKAQAEGHIVSPIPIKNAVAWSTRGYYGHVALVLEVKGTTVLIQEGNYDYNGSVRTTEVPIGDYQYIY